jgi:hypothetical protein
MAVVECELLSQIIMHLVVKSYTTTVVPENLGSELTMRAVLNTPGNTNHSYKILKHGFLASCTNL